MRSVCREAAPRSSAGQWPASLALVFQVAVQLPPAAPADPTTVVFDVVELAGHFKPSSAALAKAGAPALATKETVEESLPVLSAQEVAERLDFVNLATFIKALPGQVLLSDMKEGKVVTLPTEKADPELRGRVLAVLDKNFHHFYKRVQVALSALTQAESKVAQRQLQAVVPKKTAAAAEELDAISAPVAPDAVTTPTTKCVDVEGDALRLACRNHLKLMSQFLGAKHEDLGDAVDPLILDSGVIPDSKNRPLSVVNLTLSALESLAAASELPARCTGHWVSEDVPDMKLMVPKIFGTMHQTQESLQAALSTEHQNELITRANCKDLFSNFVSTNTGFGMPKTRTGTVDELREKAARRRQQRS